MGPNAAKPRNIQVQYNICLHEKQIKIHDKISNNGSIHNPAKVRQSSVKKRQI